MPLNKPEKKRGEQIEARFLKFFVENPRIYQLFERFAFELIHAGSDNYSSKAIFERIRWHVAITTTEPGIKINNDYAPYYSRTFAAKHENLNGFFKTRRRTSMDKKAWDIDIGFIFDSAPDDDEEKELMKKLKNLPTNGDGHNGE